MSASESIRQKTQAHHSQVRTALSLMPPMTSGEFYAQMEKVMGRPTFAERSELEARTKHARELDPSVLVD